jgi:hypothetical protein
MNYLIYIVTEDSTLIMNNKMLFEITQSGKDVSALIHLACQNCRLFTIDTNLFLWHLSMKIKIILVASIN